MEGQTLRITIPLIPTTTFYDEAVSYFSPVSPDETETPSTAVTPSPIISPTKLISIVDLPTSRVILDEDLLTSRVLLTIESLKLSRQPRRFPSELAMRLTLNHGIFLSIQSFDLSILLEPSGSSTVGQHSRKIEGLVEFAKIVPGPTASGSSDREGKTEGIWKKDKNRWRLRMELDKLEKNSLPSLSEFDEDSTGKRSSLISDNVEVPIFFNFFHTADLHLHISLTLNYLCSDISTSSFSRTYQSSTVINRGQTGKIEELGMSGWNNAEKDILGEINQGQWVWKEDSSGGLQLPMRG